MKIKNLTKFLIVNSFLTLALCLSLNSKSSYAINAGELNGGKVASFSTNDTDQTEKSEVFQLVNVNEAILAKIPNDLKIENLKLRNENLQREGGRRIFSIRDLERLSITDEYIISSIDVDVKRKKISANLAEKEGGNKIFYSANYDVGIKVPVLHRNLSKQDVITQDDIIFEYVAKGKVRKSSVTNILNLIGKKLRRNLAAGAIVNDRDLEKEDLNIVKKNRTVTVVYRVKNMELKSKAIALQSGQLGDVIKLKNANSGKFFEARVEGNGLTLVNYSDQNAVALMKSEQNLN